jgi:hypothetical protein
VKKLVALNDARFAQKKIMRKAIRFSGGKYLGLTARKLQRLFFIAGSQAIEGRSCLIVIDRDRNGDGGYAPDGRLRQNRVSPRTLVVRKECTIFGV